jgi:hypothetical protein
VEESRGVGRGGDEEVGREGVEGKGKKEEKRDEGKGRGIWTPRCSRQIDATVRDDIKKCFQGIIDNKSY